MRATHTNQAQLATDLGISKAYASFLARGERRPALELALRISERTRGAVPLTALVDADTLTLLERIVSAVKSSKVAA